MIVLDEPSSAGLKLLQNPVAGCCRDGGAVADGEDVKEMLLCLH